MHHRTVAPVLRRAASVLLAAVFLFSVVGCAAKPAPTTGKPTPELTELVLASTTSTQDSGLFDVLIPAFEKAFPQYKVKVIAVGTGEALKLGETKDADVLLVHSKADEVSFVASGFGVERRDVMYNDFIIVGPAADPAGIAGSKTTTDALDAIVAAKAVFVSRGDDSGTHKKEKKLWTAAGIEPAGAWYLSTGQGMGETLKVASEKGGYTLVDRATYLSMKDTVDMEVLLEGIKSLLNQYGVIVVTDAKNQAGGQVFADWIIGVEGQKVVGSYGVEKYGQQLFIPNAK
ncbi:MAG: substrate-binding domain-containing protein [Coriobacteriia bacterium]